MKLRFFERPPVDRAEIFFETASRRGVLPVMVEKDFWVSWTLGVLFAHPEFRDQLVFKGGTSLSKVFGVIQRFSEDIDLSVNPAFLGMDERSLDVGNPKKGMRKLESACIEGVRDRFVPELERIAMAALGARSEGGNWMEFAVDGTTHSPVVLFHYPTIEKTGFEYLKRSVKMEFGSLTDQRPVGTHSVKPWVQENFPRIFEDFHCGLVALELERTFWEKATILHAEFHRDAGKSMRDRFSRHYSDLAALSKHQIADTALARIDLCKRVAQWKSRFFPAGWAQYELAKPGTFRLKPPDFRMGELTNDYEAMRDMFVSLPPPFEEVIQEVALLEQRINSSAGA